MKYLILTRAIRLCLIVGALLAGACRDGVPVRGAGGDATAVVDEDSPRDLAESVEQMMPALERISGLDRVETLRVRRQSPDGARAYVASRLEQEMPPAEREALRRTYVVLGLLPDTLDLDALLLDLYTEQVLGYYDPTERTLFVVSGAGAGELRPIIAHELVHALQDQHTNLDSLIAGDRGNDRQTAAHAAMEGHAMLVMFTLLAEDVAGRAIDPGALPNPARELGPALEAQNSEFPVFRRAPRVIRETLLFPYLSGVAFVHELWSARAPLPRYPAPIDSLLPQSSEQIMHPERFIRDRDAPTAVVIGPQPAGWRVLRENELGQLETSIYLGHHLGAAARAAAIGWDGDRYRLLVDGGDRELLEWLSVWDSVAAADRFADSARRAAARRPTRRVTIERLRLDGREAVRITDAPAGADATPGG